MPAGDGTGPWGQGPMTGRGAGYCAGYDAPGYFGRRGGGRGWRHWYYATGLPRWARYAPAWGPPSAAYGPYAAPPTPEQEAGFLKAQAQALQQELDAISQRIAELESKA